ncbi:hypothetical protein [Sediminibacterium goheungense]|nr:hypothetical protein [Sediminibacterium goheungense]
MSTPLEPIEQFLNNPGITYGAHGNFGYVHDFAISPEAFLSFAENDLDSGQSHKDINALSNAKRAIECQMECILKAFTLFSSRITFPEKQVILTKIGLPASTMLNRFNKIRNDLEHRYLPPTPEQARESVELADMFIRSSRNYLDDFTSYFEMENSETGKKICFDINHDSTTISARIIDSSYDSLNDYMNKLPATNTPDSLIICQQPQAEYDRLLRLFGFHMLRIRRRTFSDKRKWHL